MQTRKIISISGPTGIGKTNFAIQVAKKLNAEIISFDSRQIYRELKIGVARPHQFELDEVKHHLIAHKSIQDTYSAQDFVQDVHNTINRAGLDSQNYILVGGTGFFLYALENGLDELPDISEETRAKIEDAYQKNGLEYLQNRVQEIDPKSFAIMEITNPRRLQRIVEIWEETGQIYSELIRKEDSKSFANAPWIKSIQNIVLDIPREELYQRINFRVDDMIDDGLLEEVKKLYPDRHLNALNTVGYKELFEFFEGKCNLNEAIDKIKQHSRNYAKRQITWNKKYLKDAIWINPTEVDIDVLIEQFNID